MAHHKSAKKRIIKSKTQNTRNRSYKSAYRTAVKSVFDSTTKDAAGAEFKNASSLIDKLAVKGILHKNSAARKKAQLARFVNSVA
ncbi:30S ribosomal protein S20 [candidate division KSB1 bacterium]